MISFIIIIFFKAIFYVFLILTPFSLTLSVREILLYRDRIIIKTYLINFKIKMNDVRIIQPLSPNETLKAFYSPRVINLNTAMMEAVKIKRNKILDYVFSPADREEFLAKVKEAWGEDIVAKAE